MVRQPPTVNTFYLLQCSCQGHAPYSAAGGWLSRWGMKAGSFLTDACYARQSALGSTWPRLSQDCSQAEAPPTQSSFLPALLSHVSDSSGVRRLSPLIPNPSPLYLPQVFPQVHILHVKFHFGICFSEDLSGHWNYLKYKTEVHWILDCWQI